MIKKEIEYIEETVLNAYDSGKYHPLGSDGGALTYVLLGDYDEGIRASVTSDPEIGAIRRIWALVVGGEVIYDQTKLYYSMRI